MFKQDTRGQHMTELEKVALYYQRAREIRTLTYGLPEEAKRELHPIVTEYELLAQYLERKLKEKAPRQ